MRLLFMRHLLMDQAGGDGGGSGGGGAGDGGGSGDGGEGGEAGAGAGAGGGDGGNHDDSNWDEKTKNYIQSLRKENAKYRTTAKNNATALEKLQGEFTGFKSKVGEALGFEKPDEVTPEQLQQSQGELQDSQFQNAVLMSAIEHGVGGDGLEFFQFKVGQRIQSLGEGEELTQEDMAEIAVDVKSKFGGSGGSSTSTDSKPPGDGNGKPPGGGESDVTLDQFVSMSTLEKTELYRSKPEIYSKLLAEAKQNRRLV